MEKKKVLLLCVSICLFSVSCRKSDNKSANAVLEYNISFDELVHYLPPNGPIVKNEKAHSGIYCLMSDSTHVYNAVFESKLQDIGNKSINKVIVEGYIKQSSVNAKGCFVISVQDPTGKATDWAGSEIKKDAKSTDGWMPFKMEVPLKPESKNPDAIIKLYAWNNNSSDQTFFDDIHVIFQ